MSGTSDITNTGLHEVGTDSITQSTEFYCQANFLDENVVAGLATVNDENLQTGTKAAANSLIGAPASRGGVRGATTALVTPSAER
jgi:hypothetical protein